MCGIAGSVGEMVMDDSFDQIFASLSHRGPDACGTFRDRWLRMGMHRLTFRGAEVEIPLRSGDAVAAYNGQIYGQFNSRGLYCSLPDGLESEVGAAAGSLAPDGMYAYSRYLPDEGRVTLGTDAHFIKPLFVRQCGAEVLFSSEIAPLMALAPHSGVDLHALVELF